MGREWHTRETPAAHLVRGCRPRPPAPRPGSAQTELGKTSRKCTNASLFAHQTCLAPGLAIFKSQKLTSKFPDAKKKEKRNESEEFPNVDVALLSELPVALASPRFSWALDGDLLR